MKKLGQLWNQLFLEERSSISLSIFRMFVAFTVIAHVVPSFIHMGDNYLSTAFKEFNTSIFPVYIVEMVSQSPERLIYAFVWIFYIFSFFLFIGFMSQLSAIVTLVACYYFYALNSFHVGTLSWDILLVTLFLMCMVPYHRDYFSVDSLIKVGEGYKKKRPYFIQRLLQLQIGFTFFYTALVKIYPKGNWLYESTINYLMHKPPSGVTKWFLLRDVLKEQPQLCYWIGIGIIVTEFLMIFLLFCRKTRISAIYLGVLFNIVLILTLDVPATFFFLFPAQLALFINPDNITAWIEEKRKANQSKYRAKIIYDGKCFICRVCVKRIQFMDMFARYEYVDFRDVYDVKDLHSQLTVNLCERQIILIDSLNQLCGGYPVFRRVCFSVPMLWPLFPILYFPGMGVIGPIIFRVIVRNPHPFFLKSVALNKN